MLKKLSVVALVGLLSLPVVASAGGVQPSAEELQNQIEKLTRELGQLRTQMDELKNRPAPTAPAAAPGAGYNDSELRQKVSKLQDQSDQTQADVEGLKDKSESWDLASRVQISGDFRSRIDYLRAKTPSYYSAFHVSQAIAGLITAPAPNGLGVAPQNYSPAVLAQALQAMGQFAPTAAARRAMLGPADQAEDTYKNDTMWTNRLRLNLRVKATENVTFKGRLAMYKVWGMQNNAVDYTANNGMGGGPFMLNSLSFDGNSTRQPQDNVLRVDRAYVNWTNIADQPIWFSIGRRPTTDGPPAQLRQGLDERMATPTAFMDYPFDGLTLGYAYDSFFGIQNFPGRIRFCYGRGFESGPTDSATSLRDVDFAGISWDVYHKASRFFGFQSFLAHDMFNIPDNVTFPNPIEYALWQANPTVQGMYNPLDSNHDLQLGRKNLGDIYHTTAVYMDKYKTLDYFLALGWSRTDPKSIDELGTSLLSSFNTSDKNLEAKDGYSVYAGLRYGIPDYRLKLGLEYNYGTKNWIGFVPGNDDIYAGKLATRGHVIETYMIYHLPAGEKVSKYADFFMRLGYMHYKYNYTGSGFWLGTPIDVDEAANDPMYAQFYTPIKHQDQVYLTLDTYF